jgi:parallel beta-helix repeat protein
MNKRIALIIGVSVLLPSLVFALRFDGVVEASPGVIRVPQDYTTIQAAINAANPGDTIQVAAGTYYERLTVNKNKLTIRGEDVDTAIIDGGGGNSGWGIVNLQSSYVNFSGFTVQNGYTGIEVSGGHHKIIGNVVKNNRYKGISIGYYKYSMVSERNLIERNTIANNDVGVYVTESANNILRSNNITGNNNNFGIWSVSLLYLIQDIDPSNTVDGKPIYYWVNERDKQVPSDAGYVAVINSTNIEVKNLKLTKNYQGAFFAYTTNSIIANVSISDNVYGILHFSSLNNTIIENTITNSEWEGIYLREANNNTISKNKISNNAYGIKLLWSDNNTIFHNDFVSNAKQVDIDILSEGNIWDDGYPSGGNYWSDYAGIDTKIGPNQDQLGSDGIGDTPYTINAENIDRYPLMKPWTPPSQHELVVSLKAQTLLRPGDSTLINATVINMGLSNETNVELFLMINGSIVNSATIPSLANGSAYTMSHLWTSTIEGKYNVTAYSPPVPLETSIKNNQVTIFVIVTTAKRVPYDYPSIEAAINAATSGDTILVASGTYGSVVVNKAVKLIGEDRNTTITGYIKVTADNVVISGFTIKGGIDLGRIEPTPREKSDNTVMKGNIITSEVGAGIAIYYSRGNIVSGNIITNNGGSGVYLYHSSDVRVSNNIITNNNNNGIGIDTCGNIAVIGNTVANNKRGIHHLPTSVGSRFYHNNFINNTEQIYLQVSIENSWDNGFPSGGNYWSDYTGQDSDGDGIGDTPYAIDERNKDRYPLMQPYDITVEEPAPTPEAINIVPYAIAGVAATIIIVGILVYIIKIRKR